MRAAALLSGVTLSAAVLTACNGGATEPPFLPEESPTPTAAAQPTAEPTVVAMPTAVSETPTPPPESGGMDGFRAFAALIDAALAENDASFFAGRGVEDELVCTGEEVLSPCSAYPPGTILRGIPYGIYASDASGLAPPDEYEVMVESWFASARPDRNDEFGSGAPTLYALAHRMANPVAQEAYLAIVTAIVLREGVDERQSRILAFQVVEGRWRLIDETFAWPPHTRDQWLSGECTECYDHWERWEGTP